MKRTVQIHSLSIGFDAKGEFIKLFFNDPTKTTAVQTQICLRPSEPLWFKTTFESALKDIEIDVEIIPANPLHFGADDYRVIAVRLSKSWKEFFPTNPSFTPVIGC